MARILCIWELGEDLGHLSQFSVISQELTKRGHEVFFAARDLSRSHAFFPNQQVRLLQSPVWQPKLRKPMRTRTFSEILLYQGFQSRDALQPLVNAWRNLFALTAPDMVLFDYSPAALVAAIGLDFKKIILSNSFVTPPVGSESRDLQQWAPDPAYDVLKNECHVTTIINYVLSSYVEEKIDTVSDIFGADVVALTCFKEIDFYRNERQQAIYLGALPGVVGLKPPVWAQSDYPKVFAYVKRGSDSVELVIKLLKKLSLNVLCFYAGAKVDECLALSEGLFQITNEPFDINAVFEQAEFVVCHAGMGMVNRALYHGCPMLVIPTQLEQINTSIRLVDMQVAVSVNNSDTESDVERKVSLLFRDSQYSKRAQEFSANNQFLTPQSSLSVVVDLCEDLLD